MKFVPMPGRRVSWPARIGGGLLAVLLAAPVFGEEPPAEEKKAPGDEQQTATPDEEPVADEMLQVVATRVPEDVLDVPASITIVLGEELEARGVRDLGGALALVGGVSIAPGGDGGPASAVPEMMGLREFDAFLLVVDGVPWGGAYNPAISTLDLTNVERIEVLRGAAPVLYGATSFVGVIQVIHHKPTDTPRNVNAWGGNYGSFGAALTSVLPGTETFSHSVSASLDDVGFRDDRTGFDRAHVLWSANTKAGGGDFRIGVDLTWLRQDPASPHPRVGQQLSSLVPIDANYNPADSALDDNRFHFVAGYAHPAGPGEWSTTLSVTHSTRDTVRGFLHEDFVVPPGDPNANGYSQEFSGDDLYFDTHWSWQRGSKLTLVTGVDVLAGKGNATSSIFEYYLPPDGTGIPPESGSLPVLEMPEFEDERVFSGAYALARWWPTPRLSVDAGLRLNVTDEKQEGEVEENGMDVQTEGSRSETRPSGNVGVSFRTLQTKNDAMWVYAGYTDAFKPAALDFGPEAEGDVLEPETAQTYEAGLKGTHLGGKLFWQAWVYRMDFENLVVSQTVNGLPSLTNAGTERFEGFEVETRWRVRQPLWIEASFAAHSAKFEDYVAEFEGIPVQLSGNWLEMSADRLASLGVTWSPPRGFTAWAGANYVGERYLNKRNTALADPYTAVFAGVGYRFDPVEIRIDGVNLTDRRDPVSESELGESQYYLLPARRYRLSVVWKL